MHSTFRFAWLLTLPWWTIGCSTSPDRDIPFLAESPRALEISDLSVLSLTMSIAEVEKSLKTRGTLSDTNPVILHYPAKSGGFYYLFFDLHSGETALVGVIHFVDRPPGVIVLGDETHLRNVVPSGLLTRFGIGNAD